MDSHRLSIYTYRPARIGLVLLVLWAVPSLAVEPVTLGAVTPQTTLPQELEDWAGRVVDEVLAKADPARFKTLSRSHTENLLPQFRVEPDGKIVRVPFYSLDYQRKCLDKLREAKVGRVISGEFLPLVYDYLFLLRVQDVSTGGQEMYAVLVNDAQPYANKELTGKLAERFVDRLGLKPGSTYRPNGTRIPLPASLQPVPGAALDPLTGLPMEVENAVDGSRLILIPAGEFQMGSREEMAGTTDVRDSTPAQMVWLPAYYLGKYEVTNRQYEQFVKEKSHRPRKSKEGQNEWDKAEARISAPDQPACFVSFNDTLAYTEWAKLMLPTEEMWEKAARGPKALPFPWGEIAPNARLCDYGQDPQSGKLADVGALVKGASPFGCLAMAGGVSEWCDSWYRPYPGFRALYPTLSVTGGNVGIMRRNGFVMDLKNGRILRGGSWLTTRINDLYTWRRTGQADVNDNFRSLETGFRAAYLLPVPD